MEKEGFYRLGTLTIPYTLTRSKRSRHVRLKMRETGMQIVIPINYPDTHLESLIAGKHQWIEETYKKVESRGKLPDRKWEDGEMVSYQGSQVPIKIIKHPCKDARVLLHDGLFEVYVSQKLQGEQRSKALSEAFAAWLSKAAERLLEERLKLYGEQIGVSYNQVRIKQQKTRWGSCSQKGNLNFNWRLVMAPLWIMDYVVIHELCHLKHLNHSKDFWQLVALHMPDYKRAVAWLKMNGNTLQI